MRLGRVAVQMPLSEPQDQDARPLVASVGRAPAEGQRVRASDAGVVLPVQVRLQGLEQRPELPAWRRVHQRVKLASDWSRSAGAANCCGPFLSSAELWRVQAAWEGLAGLEYFQP